MVNRTVSNVDGIKCDVWKEDESFMILWNYMLDALSIYQEPIVQV
ncbi:MAG: hypothetical protein WCJ61_15495 [Paludibacter sp.]